MAKSHHMHGHGHDHGDEHSHHHRHDAYEAVKPEEMKAVEAAFISGFRNAPDKQAFLRLSGIPLSLDRPGATALKLIEVKLEDKYQVGSASPGFATRELSYQPLPAALVGQTTRLIFVYVSVDEMIEKSLGEIWEGGTSAF